jgi:hypothetical protein
MKRLLSALVFSLAATTGLADVRLSTPPLGPEAHYVFGPAIASRDGGYAAAWGELDGVGAANLDRNGKPTAVFHGEDAARLQIGVRCACVEDGAHLFDLHGHLGEIDADVYEEGRYLETVTLVSNLEQAGVFGVAPAEDGFVLAWTTQFGSNVIRTAHFRTNDILSNQPPPPSLAHPVSKGAFALAVAISGDVATLVWHSGDFGNGELHTKSLDATSGSAISAEQTIGTSQFGVWALAAGTDGVRLAYADDHYLILDLISSDGSVNELARSEEKPAALALAMNGDDGIILTRTKRFDTFNGDDQIVSRPLSDLAAPSTIISLGAPPQHAHALFWTTTGYAAVWSEFAPNERVVVGRLTANGRPLDGAGLRLHDVTTEQRGIAAASNGTNVYVVWTEATASTFESEVHNVYGAFVTLDPAITPLTATVRLLGTSASDATVAWDGSQFVVLWIRPGLGTSAIRIDTTGASKDALPFDVTPPSAGSVCERQPVLSWNGSAWLLVRKVGLFGCGSFSLAGQRLSPELVPVGAPVAMAGPSPSSINGLSVTESGGVWLVAWSDGVFPQSRMFTARVDAGGNLLDGAGGVASVSSDYAGEDSPVVAARPGGWTIFLDHRAVPMARDGSLGLFETVAPGNIEAATPVPLALLYQLNDEAGDPFLMFRGGTTSRRRSVAR